MSNKKMSKQQYNVRMSTMEAIMIVVVAIGAICLMLLPMSHRDVAAVKNYNETVERLKGEPREVIDAEIEKLAKKDSIVASYVKADGDPTIISALNAKVSLASWAFIFELIFATITVIIVMWVIATWFIYKFKECKKNHGVHKGLEKAKLFIQCSILVAKIVGRGIKQSMTGPSLEDRREQYGNLKAKS